MTWCYSKEECEWVERWLNMPYKSLAQERYFNANRARLQREGVNVSEWNEASKGKKLPARAKAAPKDKDDKPRKWK